MSSSEPEPDQSADKASDNAVWEDLVARLESMDDSEATTPRPLLPDESDGAGPGRDSAGGDPAAQQPADPAAVQPLAPELRSYFQNPLAGQGPRDFTPEGTDGDDDGEFQPAEPEPLGSGNPLVVLAWVGALAAPALLLLSALLWRNASSLAIVGLLIVFAASVIYLFLRLPGEHDEHDDGARL